MTIAAAVAALVLVVIVLVRGRRSMLTPPGGDYVSHQWLIDHAYDTGKSGARR